MIGHRTVINGPRPEISEVNNQMTNITEKTCPVCEGSGRAGSGNCTHCNGDGVKRSRDNA